MKKSDKITWWLKDISERGVDCKLSVGKGGCFVIRVADLETFYADTETEVINILAVVQGMTVLFKEEMIK
jgi:hypothetical protein